MLKYLPLFIHFVKISDFRIYFQINNNNLSCRNLNQQPYFFWKSTLPTEQLNSNASIYFK